MTDKLLILYNNLLYSMKYKKNFNFDDKGSDIKIKEINI